MVFIFTKILIPMCWYHWLLYYIGVSKVISTACPFIIALFPVKRLRPAMSQRHHLQRLLVS